MKRRSLLILLFLLVAGVGVFVWKSSRDAPDEAFMLADGSQIEFRGVTLGTNHSNCFGNAFQRIAARVPGQLGVRLSGNTLSRAFPSPPTNAVFWFLVRKNPALVKYVHIRPTSDGRPYGFFRFTLRDDVGSLVRGPVFRTHRPMPSGDVAVFVHSTNLPPASRTVYLMLQVWKGSSDEEEFREYAAPNPLYRKQL